MKFEEKPIWNELVRLKDVMSLRELSERFDVSRGTITNAFRRCGIKRQPAPTGPRKSRPAEYTQATEAALAQVGEPAIMTTEQAARVAVDLVLTEPRFFDQPTTKTAAAPAESEAPVTMAATAPTELCFLVSVADNDKVRYVTGPDIAAATTKAQKALGPDVTILAIRLVGPTLRAAA